MGKWTLIGFILVGLLAAINFDVAFNIFHKIFFPGKSNWEFDYRVDPIIWVLPQAFFRNGAILIVFSIIAICTGLIIYNKRKENRRD